MIMHLLPLLLFLGLGDMGIQVKYEEVSLITVFLLTDKFLLAEV